MTNARRAIALLPIILLASIAQAQGQRDNNVEIYGRIRAYGTNAVLSDAYIAIASMKGIGDTISMTDTTGYDFFLPYDDVCQLRFCAPERVCKSIVIDTRGVPASEREDGHGMEVNMTLFDARPGRDYAFMEQPIGIARYSAKDSTLTWDMAVTERMRARIDSMMRDSATTSVHTTQPSAPKQNGGIGLTELVLIALVLLVFLSGGITVALVLYFRRKKM